MWLDLRPVSVLLGANSSGKTAILHAIRLACVGIQRALGENPRIQGDRIILCKNLFIPDHQALMPVAEVEELFSSRTTNKPIKITLDFDPQQLIQQAEVEFTCGHNAAFKLGVHVRSAAGLFRDPGGKGGDKLGLPAHTPSSVLHG